MGDGFDDLGDLLLGVPYQQLQYLEELYFGVVVGVKIGRQVGPGVS